MDTKKMIETLRNDAAKDKVLDEVLHVFATRERTRFILTVHGLMQRMKREGFEHGYEEYAKILKHLGALGLGQVIHDSKGRVIALKEIKITLQSLGKAVYAKGESNLESYRKRNKFQKVTFRSPRASTDAPPAAKPQAMPASVALTFVINGKPVTFSVPNNLDANDIGILVSKFQERSA